MHAKACVCVVRVSVCLFGLGSLLCGFNSFKNENRAAGHRGMIPRTERRGYRPGSDGDHGKGRWACARVGCGRAYWLYRDCIPIHTGVHTGHLTLLPPCPLDRQARAASLSTPAATEWTVLGSRPPPLVCPLIRSLVRVYVSVRVVGVCQSRLAVGVCTVHALR